MIKHVLYRMYLRITFTKVYIRVIYERRKSYNTRVKNIIKYSNINKGYINKSPKDESFVCERDGVV